MRFVTFRGPDGLTSAGVLLGEQVVDLSNPACQPQVGHTPPTVLGMVQEGLAHWHQRLADARWDPAALRPLASVQLLAPLINRLKRETPPAAPAEPVTFVRSGSTVIGPDEAILVPPDVGHVGYEAELAVVIGRRALRVAAADAMRHVAGYTAHNDVSGSDLVKGDGGNFVRGKNLPASSPLGPWLATPDEVADPYQLRIRLDIDGRPLQDGSTSTMLFRIAELISWISHRMPLDPGDVIATGTPAGVAAMHQPPAWLTPGVTVNVEVEGFGRLSNPVLRGEPFLDH